jgi:hypothetical protein
MVRTNADDANAKSPIVEAHHMIDVFLLQPMANKSEWHLTTEVRVSDGQSAAIGSCADTGTALISMAPTKPTARRSYSGTTRVRSINTGVSSTSSKTWRHDRHDDRFQRWSPFNISQTTRQTNTSRNNCRWFVALHNWTWNDAAVTTKSSSSLKLYAIIGASLKPLQHFISHLSIFINSHMHSTKVLANYYSAPNDSILVIVFSHWMFLLLGPLAQSESLAYQ